MLQAKNIHKVYLAANKEIKVLRGVDFEVARASFISLIGPSGAGKSTLLNIIGGLDVPTEGTVNFQNQDLYSLKDAELGKIRNKKIGFIFQFYHLLAEFTVFENVCMTALIDKEKFLRKEEVEKQAMELLEKVGLQDRVDHFPSQLSGGEQQRVAIARALINNPEMLLCDEPTGNLDSKTGSEIINLICQLRKQRNMSVVLVTHNPEIAKLADKVYQLKDGVLVN